MKTSIKVGLLALLVNSSVVAADVVTLVNQKRFSGKVLGLKNCKLKFKVDRKVYVIPADSIEYVLLEDPTSTILSDARKCVLADKDVDDYHGKDVGHMVLGALFGPFAMIGFAIHTPKPVNGYNTLIMSSNKELFDDPMYLFCYGRESKRKNLAMVGFGWSSWIIIYLLSNISL